MAGFDIGIEDSVEEAFRDFGQISAKIKSRAIVRAANRAVDKVRTEAGREVARRYFITGREVRKASFIKRAFERAMVVEAAVNFSGQRLSVTKFQFGKPVNPWNVPGRKHKKRGGGVRVRIKRSSGTRLIEGAFMTRAKSGHLLILQRVDPSDPRILRSRRARRKSPPGRYPVQEVITVAVPQAVGQREVFAALREHGIDTFSKEFIRQLNLLVRTT